MAALLVNNKCVQLLLRRKAERLRRCRRGAAEINTMECRCWVRGRLTAVLHIIGATVIHSRSREEGEGA